MPANFMPVLRDGHIASWKPAFYPAKLAQAKFLQHYSTQFNAVEVNFTFRQLLKETTAQKWINETPSSFLFSVKAHQVITHIKRLQEDGRFFAAVPQGQSNRWREAKKLGPVLFQLPPNLKVDVTLLREFLVVLPRGVPSAFEFRHVSWWNDEIFDLLKGKQPRAVRCRKRGAHDSRCDHRRFLSTTDIANPDYTPEERRAMVNRIQEHLTAGRRCVCLFQT